MEIQIAELEGQKFVQVSLHNETVRSEAGSLHYFRGNIEMKSEAPSKSGIFSSFLSGETLFKPTYSGTGEVYFGPPNFGEYQILNLQDEKWILDQGAYVCSDMGIEVSASRNRASSALLGGEGFYQTSVEGTGRVVVEAPGRLQRVELQGEKLAVDGQFAVARTGGIDYSVERAGQGLVGSMTSGEGLVNVFQGHGTVLMAPVPNLYQNLIMRSLVPTGGEGRSGGAAASMLSGGVGSIAVYGLVVVVFGFMMCSGFAAMLFV